MRKTAIAFLALALIASLATVALAANPVRISQVYSGGGASTTPVTYNQDYVELFNSSSSAVNIGGWTLAYGSANGAFSCTNCTWVLPANVIIQPCSYLLLAVGTVGTAGAPLPVGADYTNSAGPNMGAASGKIALLSAGVPGTGTCPGGTVVDHVSYGSSTACEGTPVGVLSKTTGAVRKGAGMQDTDVNVNDFDVVSNPVPRNSGSSTNPNCPVGACCLRNTTPGACVMVTAVQCQLQGGIYLGNDVPCDPVPCVTPTQAKSWGSVKTIYR